MSLEAVHHRIGEIGNLGVRIFFVISGFLITTLLVEETKSTGRDLARRLLRAADVPDLPAAYTFIAVVALLAHFGVIHLLDGDLLAASTYTMNFHHPKSGWLVHLWSLSVEEQFYLFWPVLLLVAGARGGAVVALAQVVLAPVIRLVIWFKFPQHRHFQHFWAVMDPIATGCLLALWHPWLLAQRSVVAFLRSKLFYAVPLGVLAMMWLAERSFKAYMAHDTLVNLGIVVCVARFVFFPEGLAGRLLNLAPVRAVGVLSYSLYLWQELFVDRQSSATIQTFPLNLLLAFTVAIGSSFLIEKPMLRLRARLAARRREAAVTPGPAVSV